MLKTYEVGSFKEYPVKEGEKTSCLIPLMPGVLFDLSVRCEKETMVGLVTEDGQTIPMEIGKIVKLRGVNRNYQAIDISTDTTFWYQCLQSRTDEEVDPTPVVIEMQSSDTDIIRAMVDERLRAWKIKNEIERELSDDEKDDLILDIVNGDLEFEDVPDAFGLGYEERLKEFNDRIAEQEKVAAAAAADTLPAGSQGGSTSPAGGSTVPST